jgi:quercetin dioxygenase-like cupin family protein
MVHNKAWSAAVGALGVLLLGVSAGALEPEGAQLAGEVKVERELQSFDSTGMPWAEVHIEQLKLDIPIKAFISDPDTGMSVQMVRYPAGFTNPWHRHNCAHGIFVLEGVLKTHAGTFGPGNFVWFPEGMLMEHGATEDGDMTMLFITNKPFDMHYAAEDEIKAE